MLDYTCKVDKDLNKKKGEYMLQMNEVSELITAIALLITSIASLIQVLKTKKEHHINLGTRKHKRK